MFNLYGYWPSLLSGMLLTLSMALSALALAVLLGIFGALGKLSKSRLSRAVTRTYTTVIRGLPDLVLMLLIYYCGQMLLNQIVHWLGYETFIDINTFIAGVGTIGFIYGAYMTETFRGAILAVPHGQLEAGYAYGMTRQQVFFRILFPQMVRHALPGFGNNWLVLLKGTAIVSVIGLNDMVRKAGLAAGAVRKPFTFFLVVSLLYLIMTIISVQILKRIERRYSLGLKKAV